MRLPIETVDHVFKNLTSFPPALQQVSLASSAFREVALPILYKSYGFRDTLDLNILCERIESEAAMDPAATHPIAIHIQELICTDTRLWSDTSEKLMNPSLTRRLVSVLPHMPNLRAFSCLEWVPLKPRLIYSSLRDACPDLKRVDIGLPHSAYYTEGYMEHVGIVRSPDIPTDCQQTFVFDNLTHVRVKAARDIQPDQDKWSGLGYVPEDLVEMLNRCPDLQSLSLSLAHAEIQAAWDFGFLLSSVDDDQKLQIQWPYLQTLELEGVDDEHDELSAFLISHPLIEELALTELVNTFGRLEPSITADMLPNLRSFTGSLHTCNILLSGLSALTPLEIVREVPTDMDDPCLGVDDSAGLNTLFINLSRFPTIHTFELGSSMRFSPHLLGRVARAMPNLRSLAIRDEFNGNLTDFVVAIAQFKHLRRVSVAMLQGVIQAYAEGDRGTSPSLVQVIEAIVKVHDGEATAGSESCPFLAEVFSDPRNPQSPGAVIWRDGKGGVEVRLLEWSRRESVKYEHEIDDQTDDEEDADEEEEEEDADEEDEEDE